MLLIFPALRFRSVVSPRGVSLLRAPDVGFHSEAPGSARKRLERVFPLTQAFPLKLKIVRSPMSEKQARVVAIYPGSFDPITSGHLDVIERGSRLCDRLIVSILRNEAKSPLFSVEERMQMLSEVTCRFENVEVDSFDGLLANYALDKGARLILRGIRAISDYEYELQMALMNRRLQPQLETVFLLAGEQFSFISSKLVKEVISLGGNIAGLVPPTVEKRLRDRLKN